MVCCRFGQAPWIKAALCQKVNGTMLTKIMTSGLLGARVGPGYVNTNVLISSLHRRGSHLQPKGLAVMQQASTSRAMHVKTQQPVEDFIWCFLWEWRFLELVSIDCPYQGFRISMKKKYIEIYGNAFYRELDRWSWCISPSFPLSFPFPFPFPLQNLVSIKCPYQVF